MNDILTVENLNKSYGDFALTDVAFSLPEGCITGFIGINGAGKTYKRCRQKERLNPLLLFSFFRHSTPAPEGKHYKSHESLPSPSLPADFYS